MQMDDFSFIFKWQILVFNNNLKAIIYLTVFLISVTLKNKLLKC